MTHCYCGICYPLGDPDPIEASLLASSTASPVEVAVDEDDDDAELARLADDGGPVT